MGQGLPACCSGKGFEKANQADQDVDVAREEMKVEPERIASETGMTEEEVRKALELSRTENFNTHWHQNVHVLLDSLDHDINIEVAVKRHDEIGEPKGGQSLAGQTPPLTDAVFTMEPTLRIKDLIPGSDSSQNSKTHKVTMVRSNLERGEADHRTLTLEMRIDLYGLA
eukprot:TRINITY_DN29541_c0_g1_i2.p1 TRINITY_DN29541_c0_g1~~TRINITY_DN29541_c0_g1_i2.p1  ORF type:complete len:190 (-),score=38.92 TRINITY_DN29541_c0_g1_i2:300-806(-)